MPSNQRNRSTSSRSRKNLSPDRVGEANRQVYAAGLPVPLIRYLFHFRDNTEHLMAFTQAVMRGPSPCSQGFSRIAYSGHVPQKRLFILNGFARRSCGRTARGSRIAGRCLQRFRVGAVRRPLPVIVSILGKNLPSIVRRDSGKYRSSQSGGLER